MYGRGPGLFYERSTGLRVELQYSTCTVQYLNPSLILASLVTRIDTTRTVQADLMMKLVARIRDFLTEFLSK